MRAARYRHVRDGISAATRIPNFGGWRAPIQRVRIGSFTSLRTIQPAPIPAQWGQ